MINNNRSGSHSLSPRSVWMSLYAFGVIVANAGNVVFDREGLWYRYNMFLVLKPFSEYFLLSQRFYPVLQCSGKLRNIWQGCVSVSSFWEKIVLLTRIVLQFNCMSCFLWCTNRLYATFLCNFNVAPIFYFFFTQVIASRTINSGD